MSDIEIEIDGQTLQAKPNAMVIEVADAAGIYIPRFCYHKLLTVAANCRMCLVEVEKSPKTLPACATPVMPGMKVFTRSPKALAAQKAVMEFLLINHPLDCPICDQGGECELQDLSMGYGSDESNFHEGKRAVKDPDLGPLIATAMTRCILCTRCVRFGSEIAGFRELGATGRGEDMEISTYVQRALTSEVSGNIIDLCPVGALTSKPYLYTARPWELKQSKSIAPHDCVGSNVYVHTRRGKVMRVVPQENMDVNQTWISDRDRFSYEGLYHSDRLEKPMIRQGDSWVAVEWQVALEFAVAGLQRVLSQHGNQQLGALASPSATLEEFYLLQKLMRQLGHSNIDYRLRQSDFSDQDNLPLMPGLGLSLTDLSECDTILLVGTNLQKEQPIASLRVRQASLKGAKVMAVNMVDYPFHFELAAKKIIAPQKFVMSLASIAQALGAEGFSIPGQSDDEANATFAEILKGGKKVCVILGAQALNHPEASQIRAIAQIIAGKTHQGTLGMLTEGANAAGAWLAGAIPHRGVAGTTATEAGLHAQAMLNNPRKGYVLLNVEPDLDCGNPVAASNALEQAEFVVALSLFSNEVLAQHANVILPIAAFTETSGTFINAEGTWQTFTGVTQPFGESRPAWKILRVLGNFMHCEGFDFDSSEAVRHEIEAIVEDMKPLTHEKSPFKLQVSTNETLSRIGEIPLYSGDSLVRRGKALLAVQAIMEGNLSALRMHPKTALRLNIKETEPVIVKQHQGRAKLPVIFDERIPEDAAYIAGAITTTAGLSQLFGPIEIHKA